MGLVRIVRAPRRKFFGKIKYILSDDVSEPDGADLYFLVYVDYEDNRHYITRDATEFWLVEELFSIAIDDQNSITAFGEVFMVVDETTVTIDEIHVVICKRLLEQYAKCSDNHTV